MSWTHLRDTHPRARRRHVCHLCELPIEAGEIHVLRVGRFEWKLASQRMHMACESLTQSWRREDWEAGLDAGEFRKMLARQNAQAGTGAQSACALCGRPATHLCDCPECADDLAEDGDDPEAGRPMCDDCGAAATDIGVGTPSAAAVGSSKKGAQ